MIASKIAYFRFQILILNPDQLSLKDAVYCRPIIQNLCTGCQTNSEPFAPGPPALFQNASSTPPPDAQD